MKKMLPILASLMIYPFLQHGALAFTKFNGISLGMSRENVNAVLNKAGMRCLDNKDMPESEQTPLLKDACIIMGKNDTYSGDVRDALENYNSSNEKDREAGLSNLSSVFFKNDKSYLLSLSPGYFNAGGMNVADFESHIDKSYHLSGNWAHKSDENQNVFTNYTIEGEGLILFVDPTLQNPVNLCVIYSGKPKFN